MKQIAAVIFLGFLTFFISLVLISTSKADVNFKLLSTEAGNLKINRSAPDFLDGYRLNNSLHLFKFVGFDVSNTSGFQKKLEPVVGLGLGIQKSKFGYGVIGTNKGPMIGITFGF